MQQCTARLCVAAAASCTAWQVPRKGLCKGAQCCRCSRSQAVPRHPHAIHKRLQASKQ